MSKIFNSSKEVIEHIFKPLNFNIKLYKLLNELLINKVMINKLFNTIMTNFWLYFTYDFQSKFVIFKIKYKIYSYSYYIKNINYSSFLQVLMKLMEMLQSESDFVGTLTKKLAPPLVTLLSSEPEVQYVALRNINLIVQKRPDILKHEMKVFFVKYNDPIYVKLEKLDIMIRLASQANIAQVLSELKEYATEVDVDFVRKAVRAIGRCAIKVEPSAERCVSTLLDLIQTKVS